MKVHKKVWDDYWSWIINMTCVTMHFVTEGIDDWPIIAQVPVSLTWCNNPDDVQAIVNKMEHEIQWKITQMIVSEAVTWSWKNWDKIKINDAIVAWFDFPDGTVFGKELNLEKWK